MRNLKKVLSLALVFVMVLAVSASATFTDQAAINDDYEEAVNMLTAIKVINGMGDGTFAPEGPVTRAQMAKMLYVAKNGSDDKAALYAGLENPFTDVSGWATNYVKWANFKDIVAGDGNGKFRPNDPVTGVEAAKMILTAVGYDPEIEGYENNAQWIYEIAGDAQELGLLLEVTPDVLGRAITREEAAQMIWKGLALPTVEGYSETGVADDDGESLLNKNFDVESHTDYLYATATKGIDGAAGYVEVNGEETEQEYVVFSDATGWVYPALKMVDGATVDPELIGHKVVQYFVDTDGDDEIDTDEDIYAVMDAGATIEAAELPEYEYDDADVVPNDDDAIYVVNGKDLSDFDATDLADGMTANYFYETATDDEGVIDEVNVKFVFVDAVAYGAAQAVTVEATEDEEEYVNVTLTVDGETVEVKAADLAGADILSADADDPTAVLVTWTYWENEDGVFSIALPETIEGYVSAKSNKTGEDVYTINGTGYVLSDMIGSGSFDDGALTTYDADDEAKYTYVVYDGKLVAANEVQAPSSAIEPDNYMLVLDFKNNEYSEGDNWTEATSENAKVYGILGTGDKGTYAVTGLSSGDAIEGDAVVEEYIWPDVEDDSETDDVNEAETHTYETDPIVEYKQAEDGTLIVDKYVELTTDNVAADYNNGSIMKLGGGNKIVADDALFFVKVADGETELDNYAVYTKGNVPTLTAGYEVEDDDPVPATVVNYKVVDGKIAVVYVADVPADLPTDDVDGEDTLLYVIDGYTDTTAEGDKFYANVFNGTEVITIEVNAEVEEEDAGWYYIASVNGVYTLDAKVDGDAIGEDGNYVLATDATIADVDGAYVLIGEEGTEVTYLNTASAKALTVATKTVADHTIADGEEHVLVIVNADATEIVAMYVIK